MPFCDSDTCKQPKDYIDENTTHNFSGYGYLVHFHPSCCPRELDGSRCNRSHPLIEIEEDKK